MLGFILNILYTDISAFLSSIYIIDVELIRIFIPDAYIIPQIFMYA